MSIFLDQIEKRKRLEEATLVETFEKGARRLGIEGKNMPYRLQTILP